MKIKVLKYVNVHSACIIMNTSNKQTTLFQSWGGQKHAHSTKPLASKPDTKIPYTSNHNDVIWLDDEDDEDETLDDLLMTIPLGEDSNFLSHTDISKAVQQNQLTDDATFHKRKGMTCNSTTSLFTAIGKTVEESNENSQVMPDYSGLPGFDPEAGRLWIYPTNYPVRDYQFNIVQTTLFKNTLVALPTGLGKTFIAAVVMYNLYRWYPQGKVVFMAPTKPLVAQQIDACYNIMGIPQDDTAEMTGAMHRGKRSKAWKKQRVFYLTPQVLMNDISSGICPAALLRCLVVDEAHKAIGNHAYCQVVKELAKYKGCMRILALSATPGTDIKAVQEVLNNLLISHIELRTEQSPDIQPYTHERKVEKVVVPLGEELAGVKQKYLEIVEVVVNRLKRHSVLYQRNVDKLSKFLLLKAREAFRQNPPENMQRFAFGSVEGDFALCLSLYHGLELLQQHGLRSLYNYLHGIMVGDKGYGRTRSELQQDSRFRDLMGSLRAKFQTIRPALPHTQQTPGEGGSTTSLAAGHPKMTKLEELVLEHFQRFQNDAGNTPTSTRIMIFSQYRDSVSEITEMLSQHRPLVKVISFIGQSSVNKSSKGFTQKEQIRVMRQFREGGYNTLVSTCVGEEGLDIGDVDLIVCFDAHKSPIRLVQRMGRTGRKRKGRIIMLLTEGREEQVYNQSQYNKRSIDRAISNGTKSLVLYTGSERMVPNHYTPRCHKLHMTVAQKVAQKAQKVNRTHTSKTSVSADKKPRMNKVDKRNVSRGFLTAEEQTYWAENLYVDPREVPKLPTSSMLTLKALAQRTSSEKRNVLSLARYTPWQNTLQKTHLLGHSQHTRHLVELMQFMEVMAVAGESGADMYDTEMKSYLCNEDVILSKHKSGLDAFLQPCNPDSAAGRGETGLQEGGKRKRHSDDVAGPSRKLYKSDLLPDFSSSEDGFATDDESDLLDFHAMMSEKSGERDDHMKKRPRKTVQSVVDKSKRSVPPGGRVKKTAKKKKKASNVTHVSDDRSSNLKLFTRVSPARRRSSDVLCVEVDDCSPVNPESLNVDGAHQDIDDGTEVTDVEKELNTDEELPGDIRPFINYNPLLQSQKPAEFTSEVDNTNDVFPFYTSLDVPPRNSHLGDHTQGHSHCTMGCVPQPPSEEELAAAIQELDSKRCVSPVDILTLIDEWEKEKHQTEVGRHFNSGNSSDVNVNAATKSPPSEPPFRRKPVRKTPKVSTAITRVKIIASFNVDSVASVGTTLSVNKRHDASETSVRGDKRSRTNSFHDVNTTRGQAEYEDVSGVVIARKKQDRDLTPVFEDRSRQANDLTSEVSNSDLMHGRPTENLSLSEGHRPQQHSTGRLGRGQKINVHSESRTRISRVTPNKCAVSPSSTHWGLDTNMDNGLDTNMDNGLDTNMDNRLDTSHMSFTQALASVLSPSPDGKLRTSSINQKPRARSLFRSPEGKEVEDGSASRGQGITVPPPKGRGKDDMGVKSSKEGRRKLSMAEVIDDVVPLGRVSDLTVSDVVTRPDTPQRTTRHDSVSPTLFDSSGDDFDIATAVCSKSNRSTIVKTTTPTEDLDVPNFSLLDNDDERCEEDAETGTEVAGTNVIETVTAPDVLDQPNFNLFDDDSFDELDFDLGFEMACSDDEVIPLDGGHRHDNQDDETRTHVTSPQRHQAVASSGRDTASPTEHISSAVKPPSVPPVISKSHIRLCDTPKLVKPPTLTGRSLASTNDITDLGSSVNDSPNIRRQRDASLLTHSEIVARLGLDDTACLDQSCVRSTLQLNLKENHKVQFIETTDSSKPLRQPPFRGRETEQLHDTGASVHEAGFRGGTMEQPSIAGKLNKRTELGQRLSVGSGAAGKATRRQEEMWLSKDDFIKPQNVMRTSHQFKKTVSRDVRVKVSTKAKEKLQLNVFLDAEAAVSGSDDASSDEEDGNFDLMEASFIDDATQLSQIQTANIDSRAMYLQSVRSPGWGLKAQSARYRLSHRTHADNEDVFSQESPDESTYLQDSFCVDSDQPEESGSEVEITKMESGDDDLFTPPRNKRLLEPSSPSDDSAIKRKKRKRIVQLLSSSDEDCQDDVTGKNQSFVTTCSSGVVDRSRSCVTKSGDCTFPGGDVLSCKAKLTTCNPSVGKSHPTITMSRNSLVDKSWNGAILDTKLPLVSYGNTILSDKSLTPPAASIHLHVANRGNRHRVTSHVTGSVSDANQPKLTHDSMLSAANHSAVTVPGKRGKLVVFVDSRKVNCAQDLMSSLRLKHDLHPIVRQLDSCDYIVSARLAVERKLLSDFTNGTNKPKLIERIQSLCQTYERPCLIVETDRQNRHGDQTAQKPLLKSRDVERTLAGLAQSHVKILFSKSQDETADLLAEMCWAEDKKKVALRLDSTTLETDEEQVLEFYLSLPKMTSATAVSALSVYNTVSRFLHSSPASISRNSLISQSKAEEIRKFVKHKFDIQMTPCRKLARTGSNRNIPR